MRRRALALLILAYALIASSEDLAGRDKIGSH